MKEELYDCNGNRIKKNLIVKDCHVYGKYIPNILDVGVRKPKDMFLYTLINYNG